MNEKPSSRIRQMGTDVSDTIAANIKLLREQNGWSVQDLSWQLYSMGFPLSAAAIGNIERRSMYGRSQTPRIVTVDELVAFSQVFEVSPEILLKPMSLGDESR